MGPDGGATGGGRGPQDWRPPDVAMSSHQPGAPEPDPVPGAGPTRRPHRLLIGGAVAVGTAVVTFAFAVAVTDGWRHDRSRVVDASGPPATTGGPGGAPASAIPSPTPGPRGSTAPGTTSTTEPEPFRVQPMPPDPIRIDDQICVAALGAPALYAQDRSRVTRQDTVVPHQTDTDLRAEIERIMRQRFRRADPDAAVARALALYDDPRLHEVTIGDPALSAAIVELLGTAGEPAIASFLDPALVDSVRWGIAPGGSGVDVAEAAPARNGAVRIFVNESARRDPAAALTPILLHEALHHDDANGRDEETINSLLQLRVWMEQVRDDPDLAATPSMLVTQLNLLAVGMLNTRHGAQLSATSSDTADVLGPDGSPTPHGSMVDLYRDPQFSPYALLPADPTDGSDVLRATLQRLAGGAAPPAKADFSQQTLTWLDQHTPGSPCDIAAVALALTTLPANADTAAFKAQLPAQYR